MLMLMKSQTEAMRAFAYVVAGAMDAAHRHPDKDTRQKNQAFVELMIPVVKGWSTETGIEVASLGVQIHGGMGFIEETGAAQHLRDARITTIYEGTTGIQANDLVGRKVAYEKGATIKLLIAEMRALDAELAKAGDPALAVIRRSLAEGVSALTEATAWLLETYPGNMKAASAGAVPFLKLFGVVAGGWQMARAALIAKARLDENSDDYDFYRAKLTTARYFAEHALPLAAAFKHEIVHGSGSVLALEEAQF
jgi:hypothetical protein